MRRPLAALALAALLPGVAAAQLRDGTLPRASPDALVAQTFGVTTVTVTYGRPAAKGRPLFAAGGEVAPAGEVWRTGANEATTITLTTDVRVEGRPLAAGTYGLFTIPGPRWTVIFNRVPNQWGAFTYDAAQDALRVEVAPEQAPSDNELFTIVFAAATDTTATMTLRWGTTRVPVRFAADTEALVRARGDAAAAAATDWRVPLRYATLGLTNARLAAPGRAWADRAAALDANYATLRTVALYAAARSDFRTAATTGDRAIALARAQATPPQGLDDFVRRVAGWKNQR